MRVRNWLLAGTSLTLMVLAPGSMARAQDAAVAAAYQAFQADQSDDNKQKLNEACVAAGFQSLDDCIASVSAPAPAAPTEQPSSEAAPPQEPAPAESSPAPEQPAAPTQDQAPADTTPAPAVESSPEAPPPPPPSSEEPPPAPPSSEQAPAPTDQATSEAPAPAPESSAPAPAPESSAPAPESSAPAADVLGELTAAVDAYNQGVADLAAGKKGAQKEIDTAKGQIDSICQAASFTDTDACLAQFGLALTPLPAPAAPSSSEVPAVSSEQPAPAPESSASAPAESSAPAEPSSAPAEQPSASEPSSAPSEVTPAPSASSEQPAPDVPVSDTPQANETVNSDAVEPAPSSVPPDQLNPLFDADKFALTGDQGLGASSEQPPSGEQPSSSSEQPVAPTAPTEPPKTIQEATSDLPPPAPEQKTALGDKPTRRLDLNAPPPPTAPQGGNFQVIEQPKNDNGGIVFKIGINIFINNNEQERNRYYDPQEDKITYDELRGGRVRETVTRPDGSKVVTIYGQSGDVLQRSKITRDGREIILSTYDPRDTRDLNNWRDPGDDLPPLHVNIKARDYILDADTANEEDVYGFLDQPPVEKVRRIYSVDEVKRSARLRDTVRRLEVGGLTFDTGKATISRNQVGALSNVADAMSKLLDRNPGEVFLIEGHTDAVGSDVSNLVLSDQRAATVARILTDFYDIPAENLVTQGYGERYLKVKTEGPEPLNRRVVIKRITPLVSYAADNR